MSLANSEFLYSKTRLKEKVKLSEKLTSKIATATATVSKSTEATEATKTTKAPVDFFNAAVTNCSPRNCLPIYAICIGASKCHCTQGNANVPGKNPINYVCSYQQKKQVVAFLLEFFFGFGAGHFYVGRWWLGLIKLLIVVIIPIILCCALCCYIHKEEGHQSENSLPSFLVTILIPILLGIILFIWTMVDAILFGINYYKDINGVPLKRW